VPRIVGVDIPKGKRIDVALTCIYGVGPVISSQILRRADIEPSLRAKEVLMRVWWFLRWMIPYGRSTGLIAGLWT